MRLNLMMRSFSCNKNLYVAFYSILVFSCVRSATALSTHAPLHLDQRSSVTKIKLPPIQPIPLRGLFESGMTLLLDSGVQNSLTISSSEKQGIYQAFNRESKQALAFSKSGNENMYLKVEDACASSLQSILSHAQANSLRKLAINDLGIEAFQLESLLEHLGLSDSQTKSIQALVSEFEFEKEQYDRALAEKLMKLPNIGSAHVSAHDEQVLAESMQAVVTSMVKQKNKIDTDRKRDFISALGELSNSQRNLLP